MGKMPISHKKKVVSTPDAWNWGNLPYSQAIVSGDLVFVSGQLGVDFATGKPAAGCTLGDVVKTNCYLTDRERDYVGFNEVYREFFVSETPARVTVEVSKLAPGFIIEIDAIARCRK